MAEFDPRNLGPLGIPGNPLDGTPMGQDAVRPKKNQARGYPGQVQPRMENPGITDVGSAGLVRSNVPQEPQQLKVPDPVSALDPAYSMHPMSSALAGLGKGPVPQPVNQGSPWDQLPPNFVSIQKLVTALYGKPGGLDHNYETQGQAQ